MHIITSNLSQLIKYLATLLPQITVHSHEKHNLKGSEILEWETVTEIDGLPIEPDKMYIWKYPVITAANHNRRMRNKYTRDGIPGIHKYLKWICSLQPEGAEESPQMTELKTIIKELDQEQ